MKDTASPLSAVLGHLSHRRVQSSGPVVLHEVIQSKIPRLQHHVQQFLLHIGIPDLDMAGRSGLVEGSRGSCGAVNTVYTDPASRHDNEVSRFHPFFPAGFPAHLRGNDAPRRHQYYAFSQIAPVEQNSSVGRGNAVFVPTVLYSLPYPFQKHSWVLRGSQFAFIILWPHNETVVSEYYLRSHSGSHGIPVNPHDPSDSPAVALHVRRTVVGLALETE